MSKFILAAITFFFINVLLLLAEPFMVDLFKENAGHKRIIDSLLSVKKMPDVLFMGSSIIRLPLWMCDFRINKDTPTYNRFFEVNSCKQQLMKKYNCNVSVGDAALDGAMISDLYFFLKKAVNNNRKPKLILLCIAPRDFADSIFPDETKTVTFTCLFKVRDLVSNQALLYLDPMQRIRLLAERIYFLHGHSDKIKTQLLGFFAKLTHRADIVKTASFNDALNPLLMKEPKVRSLREYRLRYGNLKVEQIDRQVDYLDKLADYCLSIHVPIVVVNMPLTIANKGLLPNNYYATYLDRIRNVCCKKKVQLIDLSNAIFTESDFYDTAHLNDKGGRVLIDKISKIIAFKQKTNYSQDFFEDSKSALLSESDNNLK